jgi:hypothetical protein
LRRFTSRRGFAKQLFSDNATNFKASDKELKELYTVFKNNEFHNKISSTLANNNISWSFIPPRSPNFGGLWEAGIKSVKYHIKRVIGETILTYEEMYTLLTRIEACLNSRPLFPISNDPNDLNALTPSHLLIGEVLTAPLEHDLTEIQVNRLSRWQLVGATSPTFLETLAAGILVAATATHQVEISNEDGPAWEPGDRRRRKSTAAVLDSWPSARNVSGQGWGSASGRH